MRLLWVMMGAFALMLPAQTQAQTPSIIETVVAYLCTKEKVEMQPEVYKLTYCQFRFTHESREFWFHFEMAVHPKAVPCSTPPEPWCEPPDRSLMIREWYLASDRPRHEEFMIDNGVDGKVNFGIEQSLSHEERRYDAEVSADYWTEGRPARGPEYREMWQRRYSELLGFLYSRIMEEQSGS